MNALHRWYCRSDHWRNTVRDRLAPWVLGGVDLGAHALEVGPGPGCVTDVLRTRVARVTAVEIDPALASALATRLADTNVTVLQGDATRMPFPDASFDAAVSCTMLHHVPSPALQDRLLAEVARVLRPGAWFTGSDSMTSLLFWLVHVRDTLVPVAPEHLPARLEAAGFGDVQVQRHGGAFRFRARRVG
jgi:ubiquinone/menaquinone biosynthesis C-methylase UbiE